MIAHHDSLQRFIFENSPVRGEIVHLHKSYLEVLERHPYPLAVRRLLGETLAAVALLGATIKFSGSLILQVHGQGPVELLVAQVNQTGQIRGLAKWRQEDITPDQSFAQAMTGGRIVITIDLGQNGERYQGIVELKGESLAQGLETYFAKSEQLPTFIYLAADEQVAAGMLLQVLPGQYDKDPAIAWEHLTHLSRTLTADEILHLPKQEMLHRLFHEEDVRVFEPEPINFYCHCTRGRMEQALLTMGYDDAKDFVAKNKVVTVTCEFCNRHQDFDSVDVEQVFAVDRVTKK